MSEALSPREDATPPFARSSELPGWLDPVLHLADTARLADLAGTPPPPDAGRAAAVLLLFSRDDEAGVQILLIERSAGMRSHAGQPAFPGGAVDPTDDGPGAAALREAVEETGLDPAGVELLATLPELWIPYSGFAVTPVLAWWRRPSPVAAVDPQEVADVHLVRVVDLADPANRLMARHAPTGRVLPAFRVSGMLVWGFTAGLLDAVLRITGWERPWPQGPVEELPADVVRLARRGLRQVPDGPS